MTTYAVTLYLEGGDLDGTSRVVGPFEDVAEADSCARELERFGATEVLELDRPGRLLIGGRARAGGSMSSGPAVDYYDVQRMVEDEARPLRARVAEVERELAAARDELREQVAELERQLQGIDRTLQSRTEHLA